MRSAIGAFEGRRKTNSTEFSAAEEPERRKTTEAQIRERECECVCVCVGVCYDTHKQQTQKDSVSYRGRLMLPDVLQTICAKVKVAVASLGGPPQTGVRARGSM